MSTPAVIPCQRLTDLEAQIRDYAEALKASAHLIGAHGLTEAEFYESGISEGAIQRIRGQYSAVMLDKRGFVSLVLNHMQDRDYIKDWKSSGSSNRHDYEVTMPDGRLSVIELKGCLDGNNTTIFERPPHAEEFVVLSVCPNNSSDLAKNVWSGIHTRLGPEIIEREKQVDGLIVWDWLCGTIKRPCPKLERMPGERLTTLGQYKVTPPCIYLFPRTVPSVRNNPNPEPHRLESVRLLNALNECFGGFYDEINSVRLKVAHKGGETVRVTGIERNSQLQRESGPIGIRRR